ncbi:GNAT family N-acetyltransferase [Wolbachia pipientis]|uniref:GNAT family N-acetyltransferase n=1 Tax=Wolbachia pipientis TaxID=955 RepID=A0A1E7QKP4_WOLPI|nr:GNAT family N-acetyltransferase [Wolbachia pipientis]OEY86977.1 GNAT family N-acetyltransferase [Wolbachia pipientis]
MQNKTQLITQNLKDYILYTAALSQWEIHDTFDGIVFTINDSRESLFNFVFCKTELSIPQTLDYLKTRNREATWVMESTIKSNVLEKYNIKHASTPKKMLLKIRNYLLPADTIPNLKLITVNSNQLLEQLDLYTSRIFYHRSGIVSTFFRGLPNCSTQLKFFLVSLDDKIVGTCGIYIQDNVVGFYSDGVLPIYRNQGIGTQMVLERIKIAQESKCQYAVAHCMKPSVNLYKRLGFQVLGNLYLYTSTV